LSPRLDTRDVGQGADNRSPTPNSITSSTATSSDGDTSRRRAFAVLRFSTSSLGLVPLRMRSTKKAVRRDRSEIRQSTTSILPHRHSAARRRSSAACV
jgi:hypothetical protein